MKKKLAFAMLALSFAICGCSNAQVKTDVEKTGGGSNATAQRTAPPATAVDKAVKEALDSSFKTGKAVEATVCTNCTYSTVEVTRLPSKKCHYATAKVDGKEVPVTPRCEDIVSDKPAATAKKRAKK